MRIGVLSDTHGDTWGTRDAVRVFEAHQVEWVVHCGDIGSAAVVDLLTAWPCFFVFGNVDDADQLRKAIAAAGKTCFERFGELHVEGRSIAVLHGDEVRRLKQTIDSGGWDLVCCGHSHVAKKTTVGATLVLNPGAIYRTRSPSVAIVEVPSLEVRHLPL